MADDARARWEDNPFFVLGIPPDAPRAEVERAAQKRLALLGIGAAAARQYDTPFGPRPCTEDKVRAAAAELRDPERRLVHEVWARLPPPTRFRDPDNTWADARAALGFGRPRSSG